MDQVQFLGVVDVGHYVSAWKAIPVLVLLFLYARLMTWADKDAPACHLPRDYTNLITMAAGIIGFAGFLLVPHFWLALLVLMICLIAGFGAYLGIRHQKVGLADLKGELGSLFGGKEGKKKVIAEVPTAVQLVGSGGELLPPPPEETPERAGYMVIQEVLVLPIRRSASVITVVPREHAYACLYEVDGVAYQGATIERNAAASMIQLLKQAAGLDINERRKPQVGNLKLVSAGRKHNTQLHTSGSAAGEQVTIIVEPKSRHEFRLEQLGFSERQTESIQQLVQEPGGIVILSSPRQQGLTSLEYGVLRAHDAFTNHIVTIERTPQADLEGITQNTLPANASAVDESKEVDWVLSQQPEIFMIDLLTDPRSAQAIVKYAAEGHRAYVGLRAGSTFEALAQWRKLVGDDRAATRDLRLVVNGRLIRKLCAACKLGYQPDPDTLRKLNIDPTHVQRLFQARNQPLVDAKGNPVVCEFCHDLRYKGRVGIYETVVVNDDVRKVIQAGGEPAALKATFRKQKGRYLQEVALGMVERGDTSVQEVLRIMRPANAAPVQAAPTAAPEGIA